MFAVALALVACNKNETDPVFTPELKLDKTEKITAAAEGTTANLKVTANVSWTVTSNDETVATVEPASKEITDKKSAETEVTVTISENETLEPRTATLTFKAEGCKDIVVEIEQAAAEIPDVFEVLDDTGENPAPSSFDVTFTGGSNTVYVNSNISWTATSSETWLSASPASFTAEVKEVEPIAVTIAATANTGAERSATLTFSAEGQQDVVITVNQAVAPKLEITISDITYQNATATYTPSDNELYYIEQYAPKAEYTFASDDEFARALLEYFYQTYGTTYSKYGYTSYAELFFDGLAVKGKDEISMTGLDPETEYLVFGFFVDKNMEVASSVTRKEFKTEAKPSADADYTALLGTYTFNAYDYFGGASVSGTLVVEEGVVNESYKISIPGIGWCPESGKYIDHFECPWDKSGKKSFSLIQGTIGDEGDWNYGEELGNCDISLDIFFMTAETEIDAVVLSADANGNLSATAPDVPAGDYLCLQSGIVNAAGPTGYANGILVYVNGMNFTKQVAPAAKNAVQHSVFEMPRMLESKQFNAKKVSGKLSIR